MNASPSSAAAAAALAPTPREAMLAALTQLEHRARACADVQALAFLMVNETHALAPYRQAVLWRSQRTQLSHAAGVLRDRGQIVALSGLAVPDDNAPFNTWLCEVLSDWAASEAGAAAGLVRAPEGQEATWAEYLPAHAWWLPLNLEGAGDGGASAGLLLLRDAPWQRGEVASLALLADAYAHAWRALSQRRVRRSGWLGQQRWSRGRWALAAAAALVCVLPVRQSVLTEAEVIAQSPEAVRAPLQGVIDSIAVAPGQSVRAGELLASLDARELQGRLELARQSLAVAQAELRQTQQMALFDERSKATLAIKQGQHDQAQADVDHYAQLLERTQLHASRAGVALFDDPADWVGRPVAVGERIMLVADPLAAQLEMYLPVADAMAFPADAQVLLFLNTAPASPIEATLERVGYRAQSMPDGTLAYRARARFNEPLTEGGPLRIGLKGTAKIYGPRTLLIAYVLRRPLAALRVWLGL